jgi:hypothetical protein
MLARIELIELTARGQLLTPAQARDGHDYRWNLATHASARVMGRRVYRLREHTDIRRNPSSQTFCPRDACSEERHSRWLALPERNAGLRAPDVQTRHQVVLHMRRSRSLDAYTAQVGPINISAPVRRRALGE